ncbi:SGNH/GDSL hydrolase family protein [Microbacterium sp. JZ101]
MTRPARLVFVGDSITDAGRDRSHAASLGHGYVHLIAETLGDEVHVVNVGVGGDRAVDLERRWNEDVEAAEPDVLTVYIGVNDTWRRFDRDDPTSAEDFEATVRRLLASDAARRARLILVEPFVLPVRDDQEGWLDDLAAKREVIARLADEHGASFVPLHRLLTEAARTVGAAALAPDGVHPSAEGARRIADAWLDAWRRA